ncbi:sensor of ECF-type sigma factor [Polaribacter vadi]|uniref:sensor of ECF-type sigma factor n=1 Tax=Polaribacter TaxID=52959 RepID=UPI001C08C14A|nr:MULTISPECIES: sensor of ECF-type sigma factor [Polaribacter]MBU3011971.1 sensor of ECF-type sigma factor [Polaribacter vadi]MDO6741786.1 sensor of ECF-type sigma factor [Polaribacter sp. 1_MG-2023]
MKKLITFICIALSFSLSINAQMSKEGRKKIKALKVAYLTEQMNLTTSEAEKFWPIYNTYITDQYAIRNNYKANVKKAEKEFEDLASLNEDEAKKLVSLKLLTDKKLYLSQEKFTKQIEGIISYSKILKLQIAEMEFGRKLMRKYKHRDHDKKD